MPSDLDIGWVAGLIEGEGTFSIGKDHSCRMSVRMTDEDVLIRAHAAFGGTLAGPYQEVPRVKPIWCWSITRREILIPFLNMILPHMGDRRSARIQELLEHCEQFPKGRPRVNAVQHGTVSMYTNNDCRCEPCIEAMRDYRRNRYAIRHA